MDARVLPVRFSYIVCALMATQWEPENHLIGIMFLEVIDTCLVALCVQCPLMSFIQRRAFMTSVSQHHPEDPYQEGGPVAYLPRVSGSLVTFGEDAVHRSRLLGRGWACFRGVVLEQASRVSRW